MIQVSAAQIADAISPRHQQQYTLQVTDRQTNEQTIRWTSPLHKATIFVAGV